MHTIALSFIDWLIILLYFAAGSFIFIIWSFFLSYIGCKIGLPELLNRRASVAILSNDNDFGFGMNRSGIISDARTAKYGEMVNNR